MLLKDSVYTGLNRYYNALSSLGYIKDSDVIRLLVLIFVEEFINEYEGYITNEDMNKINILLNCLSDSCLIPRMEYVPASHPMQNYFEESKARVDEEETSRISMDDVIRTDANGQ